MDNFNSYLDTCTDLIVIYYFLKDHLKFFKPPQKRRSKLFRQFQRLLNLRK